MGTNIVIFPLSTNFLLDFNKKAVCHNFKPVSMSVLRTEKLSKNLYKN